MIQYHRLLYRIFKKIPVAAVLPIVSLLFLFSCNEAKYSRKPLAMGVSIVEENGGYKLYKNGKPIFIKGAVGQTNLKELAACGGNAMLMWDTAQFERVLDEAAKYNINIIAGLDVPSGELTSFYKDPKNVDALLLRYSRLVNKYKNHPALLAWGLGNELIMPISSQSSYFFKAYNRFLKMIHTEDPLHPVTTTLINYQKKNILNIRWKLRDIDFISINTYNKIKDMRSQLSKMKLFWNGPFLVSEWSPNGGWEAQVTVWGAPIENTSTKKAEQYADLYKHYMPLDNPRFLGSMAFYWGSRHEYTHTWYSIMDDQAHPTEIQEALADCWQDRQTKHQAAQVKYMLVDSVGATANILLPPGSRHTATLLLEPGQQGDSLHFSWEILKEDWFRWGRTWNYFIRPAAEPGLITDSSLHNIDFIAPKKEGPYRIFINIYNGKGYVSTANTPFYVVKDEL